jgi:hypothetical protein
MNIKFSSHSLFGSGSKIHATLVFQDQEERNKGYFKSSAKASMRLTSLAG